MRKVSVPRLPVSASPATMVVPASTTVVAAPLDLTTKTPLKMSEPELPLRASVPVVSGRIVTLKKVNQTSSL